MLEAKFGDDLLVMRIESESRYFQINSNKTNNSHWIYKYTVSRIKVSYMHRKSYITVMNDFHNTTAKWNAVDLSNIKFNTSFRNKLWHNFMNQAGLNK